MAVLVVLLRCRIKMPIVPEADGVKCLSVACRKAVPINAYSVFGALICSSAFSLLTASALRMSEPRTFDCVLPLGHAFGGRVLLASSRPPYQRSVVAIKGPLFSSCKCYFMLVRWNARTIM